MITARDVPADIVLKKLSEELKKDENIKPHALSGIVKTGVNAERPPTQRDFWYLRSAAILRKIYLRGRPVGTERLRTAFGSLKRRGHAQAHHRPAGGKFIRLMLQQLEKSGYIKKADGIAKGRIISAKGQKFIDGLTKGLK